jgi:UDP-glucose 4-epimerase
MRRWPTANISPTSVGQHPEPPHAGGARPIGQDVTVRRAMVIGGAGFIGSHLVDRLLADGLAVDVVDDLSTGSLANLAAARSVGGELKIHHLDVTAPEFATLVSLRRPDVIYHLGCLPPGRTTPPALGAAIAGAVQVVDAAHLLGDTKVVMGLGATALYGDVPGRDQPIKEGRPSTPIHADGVVTRAIVELLTLERERRAVEFTVLALGSVYGRRQRADGGVVAAFAAALADGRPPTIHGDGRQTRDFVHVDDTVDAFARAATRGGGLVINVGTGTSTSLRELWQHLAGPDAAPPELAAARPGDVARCTLAPARGRIQLAWAPWTELRVGIRDLRS